MKKIASKSILTLLCGAMIAAAAGCGNATAYPLNIDGEDVRAGIYIMNQQSAISEAQAKLKEEQPDLDTTAEDFDFKKQIIEGISAEEWVKNKTFELCRNYVASNKLFEEKGLSLTAEELSEIKSQSNSLWTEENMYAQYIYGVDIVGEYYEGIGVSQQSYSDVLTNDYKNEALFEYFYGAEGVEKPDDAEVDAKLLEKYFAVNYFTYDAAVGGETAEQRLEKLNSGESFESVYKTYMDDSERHTLEEDKKEAEEAGETYEGDLPENVDTELPEADSLIQVIDKETSSLDESFISQVDEMKEGENKIIKVTPSEGEEIVYVVSKVKLSENTELMAQYRENVVRDMKGDELKEKIRAAGEGYTLKENTAATSLYKIDKLLG